MNPNTPSLRRVDDGATSLPAHLLQFELHAAPYSAEIDRHHPIVVFPGSISSLCEDILNVGVVVGRIEASKSGDRLFRHCFHLRLIGHITADGKCLMNLKLPGRRLRGLLIPVR